MCLGPLLRPPESTRAPLLTVLRRSLGPACQGSGGVSGSKQIQAATAEQEKKVPFELFYLQANQIRGRVCPAESKIPGTHYTQARSAELGRTPFHGPSHQELSPGPVGTVRGAAPSPACSASPAGVTKLPATKLTIKRDPPVQRDLSTKLGRTSGRLQEDFRAWDAGIRFPYQAVLPGLGSGARLVAAGKAGSGAPLFPPPAVPQQVGGGS